jgi:hypothetical protein
MKIKMTLRFLLTAVRIDNKCSKEAEEKGTLIHCWWECKLVQPLIESSMEVPQKTKNRSTIISRPTIPGHTAEGM